MEENKKTDMSTELDSEQILPKFVDNIGKKKTYKILI